MKTFLESASLEYRHGFLDTDPVGLVHRFSERAEIETAGLLASSLALGRVKTIREKTSDLFRRLDGDPARFLSSANRRSIKERLEGFRHRFYGSDDLLELCLNISRVLQKHGSLEGAWPRELEFRPALAAFARELSRTELPDRRIVRRAALPLIVSPERGSTCKRILLFLRWMVRPDDGVDFGLWSRVRTRDLVIPMDTHVFRLARALGLTSRKSPSWSAAVETTEALRRFDDDDPVRFDFALSRLGIVENCRGHFVSTVCGRCPVRPACALIPDGARRAKSIGESGWGLSKKQKWGLGLQPERAEIPELARAKARASMADCDTPGSPASNENPHVR